MEVLSYNNIAELNRRYNTIKTIDITSNYNECVVELFDTEVTDNIINTMYNKLYNSYMIKNIDAELFLTEFKNIIEVKFSDVNTNTLNLIYSVNEFVQKLNPFVSLFSFKKILYNEKPISYYVYNICAIKIYDCIIVKYIDTYVNQLINSSHKIIDISKIFGKYFTNGLGYKKEYDQYTSDISKYDMSILDKFYTLLSLKINEYIKKNKSNQDIQYIFDKIDEIGMFLNIYFIKDDSNTFYKYCYPEWSEHLLNSLSLEDCYAPVIIGYLQNIEPYIGTIEFADDIGIKIRHLIDTELIQFKPFDKYLLKIVQTNNDSYELYNRLLEITVLCEMIFIGWQKYKSLYDKMIDFCNEIFSGELIDYFYLCIKKNIEQQSTNNNYNIVLQKKILSGINLTIRTKEIDRCIVNYISHLQKRYINTNNETIYNLDIMYEIDNSVYERLLEFIKLNPQLKNHTSHTIEKFKNIINDIKASNKANQELKTIKIKYIDDEGNQKQDPTYNQNNIKYLMTSNSNSWADVSKFISNTFEINYNDELKYIVCTFNDYYKGKNPERNNKILNDCSTLIINYKLNNNTYKINGTLLQINILMLFQNEKILDLKLINQKIAKNPTELTEQHLKCVCDSLVVAKLLLVSDNIYNLNVDMKMPKKYISEPANIAKFYFKCIEPIKSITHQINETIEYDRANTIKCFVIKCVKSNTNELLSESDIFNYVTDNLKLFTVTLDDIQKSIKILIKTYYIDEINGMYKYADE